MLITAIRFRSRDETASCGDRCRPLHHRNSGVPNDVGCTASREGRVRCYGPLFSHRVATYFTSATGLSPAKRMYGLAVGVAVVVGIVWLIDFVIEGVVRRR